MANAVANATKTYEDFEPDFEWVRGDQSETLLLHLAGFKKENLKVLLISSSTIRISGEGNVDGDRWRRFRKEIAIPRNSDVNNIRARFDNGLLYVIFPRIAAAKYPNMQIQQAPAISPEQAKQRTDAPPVSGEPKAAAAGEQVKEKSEMLSEAMKGKIAAAKEAVGSAVGSTAGKLRERLSYRQSELQDKKDQAVQATKESESSTKAALMEKLDYGKAELRDKKQNTADAMKEKVSSTKAALTEKFGYGKDELRDKKQRAAESTKATAGVWQEKFSYGKDKVAGVSKRKTPIMNVAVAVLVLAGIGFYVAYKNNWITGTGIAEGYGNYTEKIC